MMDVLQLLPDPESKCTAAAMKPSVAGMYNVYFDGTNSSTADKEAVIKVQKVMPDIFNVAKENRSFSRRSFRYMLGQQIKQFIDIGSGFLTTDNTHKLVHSVDPIAKVVYVDINQAVVEHGNKLLATNGATNGTTTIICADIRQAQDVLKNPDLTRFIDFSQPVGILMMCVACFFTDSEIAHIMSAIQSTICDGSYIAVTHDTQDGHEDERE